MAFYPISTKSDSGTKVLTHYIPLPTGINIQLAEIPSPFKGALSKITVSCSRLGIGLSEFTIQRCTKENYVTVPIWENVTNITINNVQKFNEINMPNNSYAINPDDHFKVIPVQVSQNLEGLLFQIHIKS